jgi:hypothetical protein
MEGGEDGLMDLLGCPAADVSAALRITRAGRLALAG